VTASSGNHGSGVAYGLKLLGMRGLIYVPEHASPAKVEMIRRLGAEVHGRKWKKSIAYIAQIKPGALYRKL
jgi:threonine dehydratase